MSSSGDASSMADLGSAFSSGSSGVGSNSFGFTMPSDFGSGSSGDSFAGLSGLQSGMTPPSQDAGSNSYGFSSGGSSLNLQGLQNGLGAASKALGTPTSSASGGARGGAGGVRLQAQNFQTPIIDYLPATGSAGGSALLQLLQKLRPGSST